VNNVFVAQRGSIFQLVINVNQGEIHACGFQDLSSPIAWQRLGADDNFFAKAGSRVAWTSSAEDRLDLFTIDTAGKVYTITWKAGGGWQSSWILVDAKSQSFVTAESTELFALSRVKNLIEVFTSSSDEKLWKTWWT
jgi:hypothetical protein